jgi:hypothetical protein
VDEELNQLSLDVFGAAHWRWSPGEQDDQVEVRRWSVFSARGAARDEPAQGVGESGVEDLSRRHPCRIDHPGRRAQRESALARGDSSGYLTPSNVCAMTSQKICEVAVSPPQQ